MDFLGGDYEIKKVGKLLRKAEEEKKKVLEQPKNLSNDLQE
jgi:hypothetical protein